MEHYNFATSPSKEVKKFQSLKGGRERELKKRKGRRTTAKQWRSLAGNKTLPLVAAIPSQVTVVDLLDWPFLRTRFPPDCLSPLSPAATAISAVPMDSPGSGMKTAAAAEAIHPVDLSFSFPTPAP
ncbi:hypothetical protein NL676_013419 [Syzygium grande]|nr:hypothetical protein NL676_013419 [Syzygium grande]